MIKYIDAHNHLADRALVSDQDAIIATCASIGVVNMVVNSTSQADWQTIAELARKHKMIIPAFGYHPWFLDYASLDWRSQLEGLLDSMPATIGEIGLDRSRRGCDFSKQQRFFSEQLEIAYERNLPVSIHCVAAWGPLLDTLSQSRLPKTGFLLHAYAGSKEMVQPFAALGAFFSFAGPTLESSRRAKTLIVEQIPQDRLLIETDAPFQCLPLTLDRYKRENTSNGSRLNHPANIESIYQGIATLRQMTTEELAGYIFNNYYTLFASAIRS